MYLESFEEYKKDFFHELKNYAVKKSSLSDDEKAAYIQCLAGIVNNYYFVLFEDLENLPNEFKGRKEVEKLLKTIIFFTSRVDKFSIETNHNLLDKIGIEFEEASSQLN